VLILKKIRQYGIFIPKMEISNIDFVIANLPKLTEEHIVTILLNFKVELDQYNARLEKPGIGTYLYLNKIPQHILARLRKNIEIYL